MSASIVESEKSTDARMQRQPTERFDNTSHASTNTGNAMSHTPPDVHQHYQNENHHNHHNHHNGHDEENEEDQPLPDKIAATAVNASLEFLKFAGGITWNTTNTVLTPPLLVTQKFVLPQLGRALVETLKQDTPVRLQDWFRILRASVQHFVAVLRGTEAGQVLRQRLVAALATFVQVLAAPSSRQCWIDLSAGWIKAAAWLDTPECRAWLDQLVVSWIRLGQVVASGSSQQFLYDLQSVVQATARVLNDPQTTVAFAEVTAYLCYALEMEHNSASAGPNVPLNSDGNDEVDHDGSHSARKKSVQARVTSQKRRQERDQYERSLRQRKTVVKNPEASIEEVILSSLGQPLPPSSGSRSCPDSSSLSQASVSTSTQPQRQEAAPVPRDAVSTPHDELDTLVQDDEGSLRQQVKEGESSPTTSKRIPSIQVVNINVLKEQIMTSASDKRNGDKNDIDDHGRGATPSPDTNQAEESVQDMPDMEETPQSLQDQHRGDQARLRQRLDQPSGTSLPLPTAPPQDRSLREGETSVQHFYRVLDDILREQQERRKPSASLGANDYFAKVPRQEKASLDTNKSRRIAGTVSSDRTGSKALFQMIRQSRSVQLVIVVSILAGASWTVLGCYGLYALVVGRSILSSPSSPPIATTRPLPSTTSHQEIVIRVVRQVVHVDTHGNEVQVGDDDRTNDESLSADEMDKIAECIGDSLA